MGTSPNLHEHTRRQIRHIYNTHESMLQREEIVEFGDGLDGLAKAWSLTEGPAQLVIINDDMLYSDSAVPDVAIRTLSPIRIRVICELGALSVLLIDLGLS